MRAPRSIISLARKAILEFGLIDEGDRIAVGLSGGKDSLLLALVFRELARHEDLAFTFQAIHLDQKQPGFERDRFSASLKNLDIECVTIEADTHSVVESLRKPGQIPCAICARLRRGILNQWCLDNGYQKLALGHHLDDAVETFFLNLFFQRRLEPLKPLTPSEGGVSTIRPFILVEERKIVDWVQRNDIGTVACPRCDTFPSSSRRETRQLLQTMQRQHPALLESVRDALYTTT